MTLEILLFSIRLGAVLATLVALAPSNALAQTAYPRAGWETHLTQTGHGVRGTATIVDERTIRLTHFSYDGFAPDMYVYLATNQTAAAFDKSGLTASPRFTRAYADETYVTQLPAGQTLDGWNAVSIWCRAVHVSFGWGTFAPPNAPALTVIPRSGALEVKLTGEAGQKYWLQTSTHLPPTNGWQSVVLLTNVTGTVSYTNPPAAGGSFRFYRAVRD